MGYDFSNFAKPQIDPTELTGGAGAGGGAAALAATYDTKAPAASGDATGVTDCTNLLAAISATPTGGSLFIPTGNYVINQPLVVTKSMAIVGQALTENYGALGSGGGANAPLASAPFYGTVITQTTAATDVWQCTGSGIGIIVANIGVTYAAAILNTNTGHAWNCQPTGTYLTSHNSGLMGFSFRNCAVYGNDGNHYGWILNNYELGYMEHLRVYLGGGFSFSCDSAYTNYGNTVATDLYCYLSNAGTSDGYHFAAASITTPGQLGLNTFIRPQCNVVGAAATGGTQKNWNENGGVAWPTNQSVYGPFDMEASSNGGAVVSPYTQIFGSEISGRTVGNTRFGYTALGLNTSGTQNVAVGYGALAAATTGGTNTAVGYAALGADVGGANNTAIGRNALVVNVSSNGNTAVGANALAASTAGGITAIGFNAGAAMTTGTNMVAVGYGALAAANGAGGAASAAVGYQSLTAATTGANNTALGYLSGSALTTGGSNVFVGYGAGSQPANVAGNATVIGSNNTFIGFQSGAKDTTDPVRTVAIGNAAVVSGNYATAVGYTASAGATGSVALGTDSGGAGASTAVTNEIKLGTANHTVTLGNTLKFGAAGNETTGAGSALLGANCPAVTVSAPYTWEKVKTSDGSQGYMPVWK